MRPEVAALANLGPLPSEKSASPELVGRYELLYRAIQRPVSDDEARVLARLLGQDDCFGLAVSFVHLIETAPGWPLADCLGDTKNIWISELKARAMRSGRL